MVTGQKDISAAAKALKNFAAEFDKLKLKFGYLNNQRLHRAAELLIYSNLSLLDICFKVGFDNPSYFHRLFKQFHGTTPSGYRRR